MHTHRCVDHWGGRGRGGGKEEPSPLSPLLLLAVVSALLLGPVVLKPEEVVEVIQPRRGLLAPPVALGLIFTPLVLLLLSFFSRPQEQGTSYASKGTCHHHLHHCHYCPRHQHHHHYGYTPAASPPSYRCRSSSSSSNSAAAGDDDYLVSSSPSEPSLFGWGLFGMFFLLLLLLPISR